MSTLPEIWVIGDKGTGKSTLIQSISPYDESLLMKQQWLISNKYYSANVSLLEKNIASVTSVPPTCEALVLVFNIQSESSYNLISHLIQSRDDSEHEPEIRLLVATHVDLALEVETCEEGINFPINPEYRCRPWLLNAIQVGIENGFEFVETAPGVPKVDKILDLDGEEQGMRRVIMALQSHMWPNSQPPIKEEVGNATGNEGRMGEVGGEDKDEKSQTVATGQQVDKSDDATVEKDTLSQNEVPEAKPLSKDKNIININSKNKTNSVKVKEGQSKSVQNKDKTPNALPDDSDDDEGNGDMEKDMEGFDKLLQQAQVAREGMANLSDEERRTRAEDYMIHVMRMLGMSANFDDDSDHSDSD